MGYWIGSYLSVILLKRYCSLTSYACDWYFFVCRCCLLSANIKMMALIGDSFDSWRIDDHFIYLFHRNYTVKKIPTPLNDVANAHRVNPEKTELAWKKVTEGFLYTFSNCSVICCNLRMQLYKLIDLTSTFYTRPLFASLELVQIFHAFSLGWP